MGKCKLYKYKAINQYTLDALKQNKIWYSDPKYFNDIFDTHIMIKKMREQLPYKNLEKLYANKKISEEEYNYIIYSLDSGSGILSLTPKCKSNVMWAHYGDYHKGFCMEFEFEHRNEESFYKSSTNNAQVLKVQYTKTYDTPEMIINEPLDRKMLFLQKSNEWRYEEEYRVIMCSNTKQNIKNISEDILHICEFCEESLQYAIVKVQIDHLLTLLNNNYLDEKTIVEANKFISGIEAIAGRNLSIRSLANQMKKELYKEGILEEYPSKLTAIIFGYRTTIKDKEKIRNALKHKRDIKYKKIVPSEFSYKLSVVEETFS